ncbi:anti-sigma regulatory factor (Ser/Thr protein kinase) [Streptomyces rishiriensis]|uniref:Anti-sigma regulatory factor (Ser/Thr protein kinase) n=1 Tax=Streptomyces rishiriensis TaxID=68264 RepID=A0ABU0NFU6_STRRH|nr:anti-sigma regulatory factor (Ser/Thr protein kinase) [Streptomyces rishiriensis]
MVRTFRAVRRFALAQAMRLGMAGERLMDVELAVAELATNSVVHGGGRGTLAIWAEQGQLVCESAMRAGWPIRWPAAARQGATSSAAGA